MVQRAISKPPGSIAAILPVMPMEDLTRVNVERMILPKADRTQYRVRSVCEKLRDLVPGGAIDS